MQSALYCIHLCALTMRCFAVSCAICMLISTGTVEPCSFAAPTWTTALPRATLQRSASEANPIPSKDSVRVKVKVRGGRHSQVAVRRCRTQAAWTLSARGPPHASPLFSLHPTATAIATVTATATVVPPMPTERRPSRHRPRAMPPRPLSMRAAS
jgi:hypothetical protein